jgi:hypothetical protein
LSGVTVVPNIPKEQQPPFGPPSRQSPFELRLPHYVRFADLKKAGIVKSWQQVKNIIEDVGFPPGIMLSENVRAWDLDEVLAWLETRPEYKPESETEAA